MYSICITELSARSLHLPQNVAYRNIRERVEKDQYATPYTSLRRFGRRIQCVRALTEGTTPPERHAADAHSLTRLSKV